MEIFNRMQQLAEGRLSCPCGNADWKNFLYVDGSYKVPDDDEDKEIAGTEVVQVFAGCKICGLVYSYDGNKEGTWALRSDSAIRT